LLTSAAISSGSAARMGRSGRGGRTKAGFTSQNYAPMPGVRRRLQQYGVAEA
jgi:hypothetical protein